MSLLHFYFSQSPQTRPSLTGAVRQLGRLIFLGGNTGSLVSVHVRVPQSVWFILDSITHNDEAKGQMGWHGSSCCLLSVTFPLISIGQSHIPCNTEMERVRQLMREFNRAYPQ